MREPLASALPASSEVQSSLHIIAEILRDHRPLSRDVRDVLAELIDELGRNLSAASVPPTEVAHLVETTAHLAAAVHRQEEPGLLNAARARLERAILAAETKAPLTAGIARRLLDALANIGI